MSTAFQYGTETFRPLCILGNKDADKPTEFDICAVGGPSRARLKSIIVATSGLIQKGEWSPDVQAAVISGFQTGAPLFVEAVSAIRELTAPAALCVKVGLMRELPKGMDPNSQVPITTGVEFAALAGHWPVLAYELAMAIARVSNQADIDPRFFDWLLSSVGTPTSPRGIAAPVERTRKSTGTAGKSMRTGSRSTTGT